MGKIVTSVEQHTLYVCCIEPPASHPDWEGKEWVRLGNQQSLAFPDRCAAEAQRLAKEVQAKEGGKWIGRIRKCSNDPQPERNLTENEMLGMRTHILNGPDCPGKRFLLTHKRLTPALKPIATPVPARQPEPSQTRLQQLVAMIPEKPPVGRFPQNARSLPVGPASTLPERLARPVEPPNEPLKATPDDFALWSEQAKQEEKGNR